MLVQIGVIMACLGLQAQAGSFNDLPDELVAEIASNLSGKDIQALSSTKRTCLDAINENAALIKYKKAFPLVQKIEALMNKFGAPIALPGGGYINAIDTTQELWVTVMGNNPSMFKERKYCPDTYSEISVKGTLIGMCPDFPMDCVKAQSSGAKNSDEEYIAKLNGLYRDAGLDAKFRRATRAEYYFADTENGANPKRADDPDLGKYMPFLHISDKDPHDLTKPSPSGKEQPRSIADNAPNSLGFRRAGNWVWVEDMDGSTRGLVGGSWINNPERAASGYRHSDRPEYQWGHIGPARLVRTR